MCPPRGVAGHQGPGERAGAGRAARRRRRPGGGAGGLSRPEILLDVAQRLADLPPTPPLPPH